MRLLSALLAIVAAGVVASCGGGGADAGTPPFGNGGGGGGNTSATDLVVELSRATVPNTGSVTVAITTTAIDNSRNVVADAPVTITADGDAVVTAAKTVTDASGKLTATIGIGANRANRVINVTVTSGSISKKTTVTVFGAKLTGTLVPAVLSPGASGKVEYRLLDQAGNPMVGQTVAVTSTGLSPATATGTTGVNGEYTFTYTAPASGSYPIEATASGANAEPVPQVQVLTASTLPAVPPDSIRSASVQATPNVVGTNVGTATANRSEIRALFVGDQNRPIPNVRVRFDLSGDPNSIGGTFTSEAQTLYSDANGVVTSAYIPGSRSSPTDGVTVRACYGNSDTDPGFAACGTSNSAIVKLTVSNEPLGVSIGFDNKIETSGLNYIKKYVVAVADAAGNALPDINLKVTVDLPQFRKGEYVPAWAKTERAVCPNEDVNRNGVLEGSGPTGEDKDSDSRLEPGKSDVTVVLLHTKTRADGTAELQLQYPKNFGSWVDAKITVSASGIVGTEGRATQLVAPVPVAAADLQDPLVPPPFVRSPYGVEAGCANPN
jgi:Bacterial Ig-like domain (group 1)